MQSASDCLLAIEKALVSNKKVSKKFIAQFRQGKQIFKEECESLKQIMQASYRHAVNYTNCSQSAPDGRGLSASRCFSSAKAVQEQVIEISRAYDITLGDFKLQNSFLTDYFKAPVDSGKILIILVGISLLTDLSNRQYYSIGSSENTRFVAGWYSIITQAYQGFLGKSCRIFELTSYETDELSVPG